MDIQYYHRNSLNLKRSVAVVVPTKQELIISALIPKTVIKIQIGQANCCPKDQFSKKLGRELSASRLLEQAFVFRELRHVDNKILIELVSVEDIKMTNRKEERKYLVFRIDPKVERVHFIKD